MTTQKRGSPPKIMKHGEFLESVVLPVQIKLNTENRWLSMNPEKAIYEEWILWYLPVWISLIAAVVVTEAYEIWGPWGYLGFGVLISTPPWLIPLLKFPFRSGTGKVAYWVKANVWTWICAYIGNHFWTHYFYKVLGASYTFDAHEINQVPFCLFLMTHCYFTGYFVVAGILQRRLHNILLNAGFSSKSWMYRLSMLCLILILSWITAIGETVTISGFPHYRFKDREAMLKVGSLFYALVFLSTFPLYHRIDEPKSKAPSFKIMSLWEVIMDSLGNCMIVFLLLDGWRLLIGQIFSARYSQPHSGIPYAG